MKINKLIAHKKMYYAITHADSLHNCAQSINYFTDINEIHHYFDNHDNYIVQIYPHDSAIILKKSNTKYTANSLNVGNPYKLWDLETIKMLMANGLTDDECINAIFDYSCRHNYLAIVEYISKFVDIKYRCYRVIHTVCRFGYLDILRVFAQAGANIRCFNDMPIRVACAYGHLDVVRYAHENGCDITASDNIALTWAQENKHAHIVNYIENIINANSVL